ncbi:MAG: lytic transglycosylase domain-containing protein [Actinomycetota bacterium]
MAVAAAAATVASGVALGVDRWAGADPRLVAAPVADATPPAPGASVLPVERRVGRAVLGLQRAQEQAALAEAARQQAAAEAAVRARVEAQAQAAAQAQALAAREAAARASRAQARQPLGDPRAIARSMLAERGWGDQFTCLDSLWTRESGWSVSATNPSSGAYGIPQALPGSKMASEGADWRTNPATQIRWGLGYIAASYGTPCGAWRAFQAKGWY